MLMLSTRETYSTRTRRVIFTQQGRYAAAASDAFLTSQTGRTSRLVSDAATGWLNFLPFIETRSLLLLLFYFLVSFCHLFLTRGDQTVPVSRRPSPERSFYLENTGILSCLKMTIYESSRHRQKCKRFLFWLLTGHHQSGRQSLTLQTSDSSLDFVQKRKGS